MSRAEDSAPEVTRLRQYRRHRCLWTRLLRLTESFIRLIEDIVEVPGDLLAKSLQK